MLDQVADALGAAHALGILHRDLKPSNLLVCEAASADGKPFVKVADFGVAKAMDTNLAVDRPRDTQRGEIVGSPAFMSPEQLRDAASGDGRSDLWSVGAVAYEALTGRTCFDGRTLMDTFAAIAVGRYLPPSSVRSDLPRGLDAWFARALAVDPAQRFASAQEMAQSFRAIVSGNAGASRRPLVLAALIASAALFAAGVGFFLLRGASPAPIPAARPDALALSSPAAPAPVSPKATASAAAVVARPSADKPDKPAPSPAPAHPQAVRASVTLPATPRPAAAPAPAPKPSRPSKGIDPSEIQ